MRRDRVPRARVPPALVAVTTANAHVTTTVARDRAEVTHHRRERDARHRREIAVAVAVAVARMPVTIFDE